MRGKQHLHGSIRTVIEPHLQMPGTLLDNQRWLGLPTVQNLRSWIVTDELHYQ
jgi:hypothetical protein